MSSTKKSRRLRISDDTDSENEEPNVDPQQTPKQDDIQHRNIVSTRSSERLNKKRNKEFHMPSRKDVYKNIPVLKDNPGKSYLHLQPRKLINDFTKVTSRYNQAHDPDWSTGSESDFIDDSPVDEVPDSESDSQSVAQAQSGAVRDAGHTTTTPTSSSKKRRVKRLRRISKVSSSSEENRADADVDNDRQVGLDDGIVVASAVKSTDAAPTADGAAVIVAQATCNAMSDHSSSDDGNDDNIILRKVSQNKSIIASDDDDDNNDDDNENVHTVPNSQTAHEKINNLETNAESASGSDNDSVTDSSSQCSSESSDDHKVTGVRSSRRAKLMMNKKEKWRSKFEEYKKRLKKS